MRPFDDTLLETDCVMEACRAEEAKKRGEEFLRELNMD